MDSNALGVPVSNPNTHHNDSTSTFSPLIRISAPDGQHQNQNYASDRSNGSLKLFSLTGTQSQRLSENETPGVGEQSAKRFGAPVLWNRRQPFAPQSKRINTPKSSGIFQGPSRGPASARSSLQLGNNFKFTTYNGTLSDQHHSELSSSGPNSSGLSVADHNECRDKFSNASSPSQSEPVESYNSRESPTIPNDSSALQSSEPRALPSPYTVSPLVTSQHHDPDGDGEDPYTQALRCGASRIQQYKAELQKQQFELEDVKSRLSSEASSHIQETTALRKELLDLRQRHEAELAALRESGAAEVARVKEDATREIEATVTDARKIREELLRVQESSKIHAERDRADIELSRRKVEEIKELAKKTVDGSNRKYSELQIIFQELKKKHDETYGAFQSVASELQGLRKLASQGINSLAPLVDNDAMKIRNQDTKALIAELQQDRDNSLQVNEMLRHKLHVLGAQLADAQDRVRDLESHQIAEGGKVELCSRQLAVAGEKLALVSSTLDVRERDAIQALAEAARLEERAKNSEDQCESLLNESRQKSEKIALLKSVEEKNVTLSLKLMESEKALSAAMKSGEEIATRLALLEEEKQKLRSQLADLKPQHTLLLSDKSRLSADLSMTETQKRALEMQVNTLQTELEHSTMQIKAFASSKDETVASLAASADNVRLLERENGSLREKLRALEQLNDVTQSSLDAVRRDLEQARLDAHASARASLQVGCLETSLESTNVSLKKMEISLANSEAKCSMLQERFDSQTAALRLAREHSDDLQQRLIAAEASHSTKLDASNSKWQSYVDSMTAHNSTLTKSLASLLEETKEYRDATIQVERRASQQETIYRALVESHEQRAATAEREVLQIHTRCDDLQQEVSKLSEELDLSRNTSTNTSDASSELLARLNAERGRLEELQLTIDKLRLRTSTILQRYRDGDLDDPEKAFVASLMQTARSVHEENLIEISNDLHRKDGMISSLQKKILTLESLLARRLQAKEQEIPNADDGTSSIINVEGWVLSSPTLNAEQIAGSSECHGETGIDPSKLSVNESDMVDLNQEDGSDQIASMHAAPKSEETSRNVANGLEIAPASERLERLRKNTRDSATPGSSVHLESPVAQQDPAPVASGPYPLLPPSRPNFTELDNVCSDLSDPEDDVPLCIAPTKLGKHPRAATPTQLADEPPKPARKPRTTARKPAAARCKRSENTTQAKTRKR